MFTDLELAYLYMCVTGAKIRLKDDKNSEDVRLLLGEEKTVWEQSRQDSIKILDEILEKMRCENS